MPRTTILTTTVIALLAVVAGLGAGVVRVDVGPTSTATATYTSVPTQTPLPTYTPPATSTSTSTSTPTPTASATPTPEPTWTPQPTYTPYPTPTVGPDPEAMFLDGLYAMCLAGNGYLLEHLFFMPFDCDDIVTGANEEDWYLDEDFHFDRPTTTPSPPPVYRPGTDPLRDSDGSA